jgi:hypothetical protein
MKHAIPLNLLLCLVSPLCLSPKTAEQAQVPFPSVTQAIVWNPSSQYPNISIWPGDRYHATEPVARQLESGGQSFVVKYILRDGCHACAQVGTVKLSFVFDKHGKFSGVESGPTFPRP